MKSRSVIIVGGGIAGLTLARFLARDGHKVTVIERAKDFSAQGHSIGFRGVGLQVMEELGLRQQMEATGRNFRMTRSYTLRGWHLRSVPNADHARAVGGIAVTQRGRVHAVLHDNLPPAIDLRFGLRPVGLREENDQAVLELNDGSTLKADILVGSDGANSTVRKALYPDAEIFDFKCDYVGMTIATDHGIPLDEMAVFYDTARLISFFPVHAKSVAVVLYQDDGWGPVPADNTAESWAPFLQKAFARSARPIRRILAGIKPGDDIYHDRIVQVLPNQAVKGRFALVGDAGYCPTFLSGNGAAVAAVGAWCLARSLRSIDDDAAALRDYETRILPFVAGYQANARQMRDVLFMRARWKLLVRRLGMKFMPHSLWARRAAQHYKGTVQLADAL